MVSQSKHKTFIQCWSNVEDVGPRLYKCYIKYVVITGQSGISHPSNKRRSPTVGTMLSQHWVNVSYCWDMTPVHTAMESLHIHITYTRVESGVISVSSHPSGLILASGATQQQGQHRLNL